MNSLNVSYQLNNLGPWADPLLTGILGGASSVNMLEPLSSALPVIQAQPGAFIADHLLDQSKPAATPTPTAPATDPGATTQAGAADAGLAVTIASKVFGSKTVNDAAQGVSDAWKKGWEIYSKNVIISLVGLMLIAFGLWILLAPTVKPIVVGAAKEGAKAAAA